MIKQPAHPQPVINSYIGRVLFILVLLLFTAGPALAGNVSVDYFYESGCLKCEQASPVIEEVVSRYPEANLSVYEISAYFSQAKQYGVTTVPAVVINRSDVISYGDYNGDTALLESMLSEAIETAPPVPVQSESSPVSEDNDKKSLLVVFIAGLLAGFNPCLIAVMAFLASVIVSSGGSRRDMLILVTGFCAGIFVTYMIAGFGILNAVSYFPEFREAITTLMVVIVAVLGIWHLYDAYYIKKHSKSSFSTPRLFVNFMEKVEGRNILLISFAGGSIFSLVKAPCVGAVYLMILEMLIGGDDPVNGILYLSLYNLGVVLPVLLLGAFLAFGLNPEKVNDFREKRRVEARLITGIILVVLALMLNFDII